MYFCTTSRRHRTSSSNRDDSSFRPGYAIQLHYIHWKYQSTNVSDTKFQFDGFSIVSPARGTFTRTDSVIA